MTHKKIVLRLSIYNDCQKEECHTITWDSETQEIHLDNKMFPSDFADFSSLVEQMKQKHHACTGRCDVQ